MKQIIIIILAIAYLSVFTNVYPQSIEEIDSINVTYDYSFIVSNTRKAIKIFEDNVNSAKQINYQTGLAKALSLLGLANYINGNLDAATQNYIESIKIYEELGEIDQQASLYGDFGYQLKRRDMDKANKYMWQGIKIAEANKLPYLITHKLYSNYGTLKEMENQLDSAMYFYEKTLKMNLEANDSLGLPYTYNKIAGIKAMQGNFDEAFYYLNKSDEIRAHEKGDFGRAENLSFYGDFYMLQNKIPDAIRIFKECLQLSKSLGYKYLVLYSSSKLKELFEKQGNYKEALYYFEYYKTYTDSLSNIETNSRIAELEIDYETEKKDRQLAESNLEIQQKSVQLLIAIGIVIILSVASVFIYRTQKVKRERERKELELKTKLKEAEIENKLSSEKLRISRELHDNIGSQLTFMISSLDNLTYVEKNEKLIARLNRLSSFGRDTMKELRNTIWAMKHEDGDLQSLVVKLNELVHNLNQTSDNFKISISNQVQENVKLSSTQMLAIFRIVQEAVQNTIKYAEANKVDIELVKTDNGFGLKIIDDGNGFDVENGNKGNGISNMKFRCEESGGKFNISSSSKGTCIKCNFINN